jgi:RNA polymerase sigma-70 factor (ECF subfamily)
MTEPYPATCFPTTEWSRIVRAGGACDSAAHAALEGLCRDYWFPLYALARRRGLPPAEAEDAVQGLLADLLERSALSALDQSKGRFRAFLRTAFDHYLSNRRDHDRAARRGGGRRLLSIDRLDAEGRYEREPGHALTPERLFERQWALALLEHVLARLEAEAINSGKADLFERLRPALQGDALAPSARDIGAAVGLSEGAVRTAAHRLRARYRGLLREEVARTTDDPNAVDAELVDLLAALSTG